jgi:hypothetical protein
MRMPFILDMVHHNPGEPPTNTAFVDPAHLAAYGFNGQVFKHINCIATYAALGVDVFPAGSPDRQWLDRFRTRIEAEIAAAKAQGLSVFYHLDLFVLPKRLVEHFKDEICDPETGRIVLDRPRTLEIHQTLFDELSERFPQVDGYIIRVGETYLYDTPYHTGNGPIPRIGPAWTPTYLYDEALGEQPCKGNWSSIQADAYVTLIRFLREAVCVKHGKYLMFRTWDIFPDKLHSVLAHYRDVADRVETHPKLLFSIKHTALDFWRHVKVNECLEQGRHPQIIEVQCQREYEGKGAYPNYVMDGVINSFEENARKIGLADLLRNPQIQGIYSWSRGGGWYGPYLKDELWCDLNAYVLAQFVKRHNSPRPLTMLRTVPGEGQGVRASADPCSEESIFRDYARQKLGLSAADTDRFRKLCTLSARAILKGRYCQVFDRELHESVLPVANWMRDDRLGGREQLAVILDFLDKHQLAGEALAEKAEAVQLWDEIKTLAQQITWPDARRREQVTVSVEYGRLLFNIVHQGWRVLLAGHHGDVSGQYDRGELSDAIARYDAFWREYRALASSPLCPSLYEGRYFNMPGGPVAAGLDESVDRYRAVDA